MTKAANPLQQAITNLTSHCEAVLNALGSPGTSTPDLRTNPHNLNILYPHIATSGGPHKSAAHLESIEKFLNSRPDDADTFVSSSYPELDLRPLGFEIFFTQPWTAREPAPVAPGQPTQLEISKASTPAELAEFEFASQAGFETNFPDRSYADTLLNDNRYTFYLGRSQTESVSGILTFTDSQTLGIYTLFTLPHARRKGHANALLHAALADAGDLPAFTNPSEKSAGLFQRLRFKKIATRTIWVRRAG